jgi:hypothetical protein
MDRGYVSRLAAVLGVVLFIVASVVIAARWFPSGSQSVIDALNHPDFGSIVTIMTDHVLAYVLIGFAVVNYHAILRFVSRTIRPTDAQIVGKWYVARYFKKNNSCQVINEEWYIRRDWSSRYNVKIRDFWKGDWKYGRLAYNERDRFNILLIGANHQQQSLVCFQTNIAQGHDTRVLGLGVGDDSQYILSARVYLASRSKLPGAYIRKIIDDATAQFQARNGNCPLLQLPTDVISKVFDDNPLPDLTESETDKSAVIVGVFDAFSAMLVAAVRPLAWKRRSME